MATLTIRGIGQRRGPVIIHKSIEIDDAAAKAFTGSKSDDAILGFIAVHYPGTTVNPRQISVNVVYNKK